METKQLNEVSEMYQVSYNVNSDGYSAIYYYDNKWLGMTDEYDTFDELQVIVSKQLSVWVQY